MAHDFARSISQRRALRRCGYLWYLKHVEGYRTLYRPGTYAFGDIMQLCINDVIAGLVTNPNDASAMFTRLWALLEPAPASEKAPVQHVWHPEPPTKDAQERGVDITCLRCGTFAPRFGKPGACGANYWGERASWKLLRDRGGALAQTMYFEMVSRFQQGTAEHPHSALLNVKRVYEIAPGVRETIKPDYVGLCQLAVPNEAGDDYAWHPSKRVRSVIDFKTSDRAYNALRVEKDEQLTDYQLGTDAHDAERLGRIEQLGLCVLIYTAVPRVQWILTPARDQGDVDHFLNAALSDERRIQGEEFAQDPSGCFAMGECDMVPVCYGSQRKRLKAELTRDDWKTKKTDARVSADW